MFRSAVLSLGDVGTLFVGVGSMVTAVIATLTYRKTSATHSEVKTLNGKTVGVIIEEGEDRRLAAEASDENGG